MGDFGGYSCKPKRKGLALAHFDSVLPRSIPDLLDSIWHFEHLGQAPL
jgi:hypothetical protein